MKLEYEKMTDKELEEHEQYLLAHGLPEKLTNYNFRVIKV